MSFRFHLEAKMLTYKNKNSKIWGYRRLFGFFRRKKPQLIDFNYSYQYMTRFRT